jgi:hypothetical protein
MKKIKASFVGNLQEFKKYVDSLLSDELQKELSKTIAEKEYGRFIKEEAEEF